LFARRLAHVPSYSEIIFLPKSESIGFRNRFLTRNLLLEVLNVTTKVKRLEVTFMGQIFSYGDICARWKGECYESAGEKLLAEVDELFSDDVRQGPRELRWPVYVWYSGSHFDDIVLPEAIGSPDLDREDFVTDAKAYRVSFLFRSDTDLNIQA
jgi:hypothetical protein